MVNYSRTLFFSWIIPYFHSLYKISFYLRSKRGMGCFLSKENPMFCKKKERNQYIMKKTKEQWKTPHTFVILVSLIILAAIATHFVPAGEYVRYKDEVTGRTLVEVGSYHRIDANPISLSKVPGIIFQGIVKSATTITFMLIIGGAFEIITSTGALTALCKRLSNVFAKKKYMVIPAFLILFSIFGFTMGMSSEVMIFVPIGITLALFLGLDKVTGTAMITMGAANGFTAGLLNPFNVGVAQDIAELPMFSGIGYRAFILIVLLIIDSVYIIHYAKKVEKDPKKSIIYGEPEDQEYQFDHISDTITKRQVCVLLIAALGFGLLIYGLSNLDWYFEEMSALFIVMGIACGLTCGYDPSKIAKLFGEGAKGIIVGCLIIGIARGVEVVLSEACILDTIVYGISNLVSFLPHSIQAVGMFLCQSFINCVIVSGTGQAAVTMPLMIPVSDLVGVSRQTAVLAFQLGDGFSNSILPMSSSLMGFLAVSKIPYTKWLKFMVPLFLIWTLFGCLFMIGALIIGY